MSPSVQRGTDNSGAAVRVLPVTAENVLLANRSPYQPKTLPAVFSMTSGGPAGMRGMEALPDAAFSPESRPAQMETRVPPPADPGPYRIGIGDVVLLATPQAGSTVEELSGLLAAQTQRQGYTVQDDGAIAVPNVGRIQLAGKTFEDAEAEIFQRLVESQIEPTFSLEIAEFNSKKVTVGGAVAQPAVAPITLTPLYLDEALAAAGGTTVADRTYATVRLYRDGTLYQIPLDELYARRGLQRIRLVDGDSIFVDTEYALDQAAAYFQEQIQLAGFRQSSRQAALEELTTEIDLRRSEMAEARDNYMTRTELGAVDRDYVYLTGEVRQQGRMELPFEQRANLADALYSREVGGVPTVTANVSQIYVLRSSSDPQALGAVTAWRLDGRNAANVVLATKFELRPDDIIFVAEQPVTRWNRVVNQIVPSLLTYGGNTVQASTF
ncbi:polysaccharide biosynthesis/export family protein [Mangrovicoccus sp. HB161399]|uniref:polysaccharide biosynthesis/export family protein n=1 Tax=Mangrovicoccus sp. HB161399 TaxID=2720392 RepID=UPI00155395BC|nr:polysaccharide biosynthesis/export family protein [Mangrovicoccus sp. HB161399]